MTLNTEMEKAAFLIYASAVQLQKADGEINRDVSLILSQALFLH